MKNGIKKFEIYLIPKKFLVRSNNKQSNAFLKNNLERTIENKRLIRLEMWFSNFEFEIEYIKEKDNVLLWRVPAWNCAPSTSNTVLKQSG